MVEISKNTLLWIAIVVLFLAVMLLTFKSTGNVVASESVSAGASAAKSAASSGMVGGC